jgi:hypothetical protein
MVFNATLKIFSYIVAVSVIGGGNRSTCTTDLPQVSDKLDLNVVSSTPHHERDSKSQC